MEWPERALVRLPVVLTDCGMAASGCGAPWHRYRCKGHPAPYTAWKEGHWGGL